MMNLCAKHGYAHAVSAILLPIILTNQDFSSLGAKPAEPMKSEKLIYRSV